MKQRQIILLGISLLTAISSASELDERLTLMQSIRYTDDKQCHYAIGEDEAGNIVNMLIAAHSQPGIDSETVLSALNEALKRGCSLNELDRAGLSPLAAAVLFNDADMVRFLLKHGADTSIKIHRPDSLVNGMNTFEFFDWLMINAAKKNDMRDRTEIQKILAEYNKIP